MNYINSINGISDLGALPNDLSKIINSNKSSISKVLVRANKLNGLGSLVKKQNNLLSASEVIKRYNAGISEDEIKAWVWYRRSIGIPMTGWDKYYIDSKTGGVKEDMLVTTDTTTLKDTAWRDVKTVPKGTLLGKQIGNKEHQSNDLKTYVFYRDNDGITNYLIHRGEAMMHPDDEEDHLRVGTMMLITIVIMMLFMAGCSGSQKASLETPTEVTGHSNTITTDAKQTASNGQSAVSGDVEKVENTTVNGTNPLLVLIAGLVMGFLIPQPKFIRMWF